MLQGDGPSLAQIWGFFFLLLGPIKIIAPFVRMTAELDQTERRRLAVRAALFATCIMLIAGTVGVEALKNYKVSPPVLALTGGLVLFLVALRSLLEQFHPTAPPPANPSGGRPPATQLAYPIIVTPSGIAAIIIFMTLAPEVHDKAIIAGLLLLVMALDLLAMLFAAPLLRWFGMPLMVLGTVLGVIQTALGLNIMLGTLRALGVIGAMPG